MKPRLNLPRGTVLLGLGVLLLLALVEAAVQYSSGAWHASYGTYPDEPSHFVSALLVRDFIASGAGNPLEFAKKYYVHQPFFAVGYWPPLFYLAAGAWMLLFGYTRVSIMLFTGGIATVTAWLVYESARRSMQWEVNRLWMSVAWAVPTAVFFLLIPSVRWSSSLMMADMPVALLCLITTFALGRFLGDPTAKHAIIAALLASLTLLTKFSAGFVLIPPVVLLFVDRRWHLLARFSTWIMPAIVLVLVGPWIYLTQEFTMIGMDGFRKETFWLRLKSAYTCLNSDFGSIFGMCCLVVLVGAMVHWKHLSVTHRLLVLHLPCVILFVFLTPVGFEQRYLLTAYPAMLVLFPVMVYRWFGHLPQLLRWGPLAFSAAIVFYAAAHPSNFAPLKSPLMRQIAEKVVSEIDPSRSAVLVASAMEGPMVAELASQLTHRPTLVIIRSTKLLARTNWLGTRYELTITDEKKVREIFDQYPIDIILIGVAAGVPELPHDAQLRSILATDSSWSRLAGYKDVDGSVFEIYKRAHVPRQSMEMLASYIRNRLPKVQ